VCDEAHDDELMDAVLLELQIQVRVGEAAGTPMFLRDDLSRRRRDSARNSPPQVPYSKDLCCHAALWTGATYFHVS